jgi:hypothetical protein
MINFGRKRTALFSNYTGRSRQGVRVIQVEIILPSKDK